MRAIALATALLLAACERGEAPTAADNAVAPAPAPAPPVAGAPAPSASPPAAQPARRWDLQSSGEGVALALLAEGGRTAIGLFCPAGGSRLVVNVPAFRPIGSEERLSFGGGGDAVALVADPRGDRQRGGVSGTGPVPANLGSLVDGPLSASYGAQSSGPHAPPPPELARAFVAACPPAASGPVPESNACGVQGGERLANPPLRVVGTEPFWAARIDGRCVTYSHPDDQSGTRVWTRYSPGTGGGGTWTGALGGGRFELRISARPGCSDGMSDRRYPLRAELLVGGEQRRGCAHPL